MKNNVLTTAAAVAAIAAAPVMAGEPAPVVPVPSTSAITADLTLGYHSDYAYRGIVTDDSLTDDVFSFGLGLTYDDGAGNQFFADLYYRNLDSGDFGRSSQFSGIGLDDHTTVTVGARRELIPNLTGTLAYAFNSGGIYRDFDNGGGFGDDNGHELQAKLDYAITPDFVVYGLAAYEFNDSLDGFYLEAGAAYNYQISDQVSVVASAAIAGTFGYLPEIGGIDNDGLSHFELRLSFPVAVTQGLTVTPYVSYIDTLDVVDDYADAGNGLLQEDAVIGGVEAVLTF